MDTWGKAPANTYDVHRRQYMLDTKYDGDNMDATDIDVEYGYDITYMRTLEHSTTNRKLWFTNYFLSFPYFSFLLV